ncbi:MAG: hypothetical protein V1750_03330 [Acidobacteriota bacterium]
MSWLREESMRVLLALLAFVIAALPERVKQQPPFEGYSTVSMHVLSGIAEIIICAGLFIVGMIAYVTEFTSGAGWAAFLSIPRPDTGHLFGIGVLGYVSYLFRPTSLLLVYCFAEGIARTLDAALWERQLGVGLVAVPWRAVETFQRRARRAERALRLGPARPDEIIFPPQSRSGLLEIFSVEDKPWSDFQVIELGGEFYQLATRRFLRHGKHHAYRYQLHPLEAREVIRGAIVKLAAPPPSGASGDEEAGRPNSIIRSR